MDNSNTDRIISLMNYNVGQSLHENKIFNSTNSSSIFTNLITQDGRYAIIMDDLYDNYNSKNLGNIWEKIDNFILFCNHLFESAKNLSTKMKEILKEVLNKFNISESRNDSTKIKEYFRISLTEQSEPSVWNSFGTWVIDSAKSAVKGTTDFFQTSFNGAKQLLKGITEGDWKKVIDILKRGVLYTARSLRSLLYSPTGIILDAVLIATGIGKGFTVGAWAIVVALDLYEIWTGDYENKDEGLIWKLISLAADASGLLFAGASAKAFKVASKPMFYGKSAKEIKTLIKTNPTVRKTFLDIYQNLGSTQKKILEVIKIIKPKSPKIAEWMEKIVSNFDYIIRKINQKLQQIGLWVVDPKKNPFDAARDAILVVGGITGAIGTYTTHQDKKQKYELQSVIQNLDDWDGASFLGEK